MELLATLLGDLEPNCLVEIGGPAEDATWAPPGDDVTALVVRLHDRAGLVRHPERLDSELDALELPLDVLVDHATDDVGSTMQIFEMAFGRLTPEGTYVVDGSLPSSVVLDLMMASVASAEWVERVSVVPEGVIIRRGSAAPRSERLRLADLRSDPFGIAVR